MPDAPTASTESRAIIERLIAFDTTSRNSNLDLIHDVRDYLAGFGIESHLTYGTDQGHPLQLDMDVLIAAMGHDLGALERISRPQYFLYGIGPYLKIAARQGVEGLARLNRGRRRAS